MVSAPRYEYQHDPLPLQEQQRRAQAEASRKAKVTEAPFKPSNPAKKGEEGKLVRKGCGCRRGEADLSKHLAQIVERETGLLWRTLDAVCKSINGRGGYWNN
jgi:hypothetical protein